jgi:DNA adenine methylase
MKHWHKGAFPWRGGKSKIAGQIITLFPEHTCFVDAFMGSGGLFFSRHSPAKVEIINDLDNDIVAFFRVLRNDRQRFLERISLHPYSRVEFSVLKKAALDDLTDFDKAVRFYVLQCQSFSGGGSTFGSPGSARSIPKIETHKQRLYAIAERLLKATIENLPFERLFSIYDSSETLFYLDPPYYKTCQYKVGKFPESSYGLIADLMKSCKGKVALSINDHPFIRDIFKDFPFIEIANKSTTAKGKATQMNELVISNYILGG